MIKRILIGLSLLTSVTFANPFGAGNVNVGVTVGNGSVSYSEEGRFITTTHVEDYYIIGVSGDYFIYENLALGLGYRGWVGGTPTIHQGSVPLTYYIPTGSRFRPYVGALYRYTYIADDTYDGYNSVGGRAGLTFLMKSGYVGLGWVQEYRLDAEDLSDTSSGYPEIVVGFSF